MPCDAGSKRTIEILEVCANDPEIAVVCTIQQVCERRWWKFFMPGGPFAYYFWTAWYDVPGTKVCPACPPPGVKPAGAKFYLCCFAGAFLAALGPVAPPGPIPEVVAPLVPGHSPPPVPRAVPMERCVEVSADTVQDLLDNLRKALEILNNMGDKNEADTQQKAIDCLRRKCRAFGWPVT